MAARRTAKRRPVGRDDIRTQRPHRECNSWGGARAADFHEIGKLGTPHKNGVVRASAYPLAFPRQVDTAIVKEVVVGVKLERVIILRVNTSLNTRCARLCVASFAASLPTLCLDIGFQLRVRSALTQKTPIN